MQMVWRGGGSWKEDTRFVLSMLICFVSNMRQWTGYKSGKLMHLREAGEVGSERASSLGGMGIEGRINDCGYQGNIQQL